LPLRGGSYWNNGLQAGVFALNLNNRRSNISESVGFRAALPQSQIPAPYGAQASTEG